MSDPERLSEIDHERGAELLRSAKRYRVSEATRQRALATVGLAAGASAIGATKLASAAASGAKLYVLGLVSALVVAGGYWALASKSATRGPPSASVVRAPPAAALALVPFAASATASASAVSSVTDAPAPSANLAPRAEAPAASTRRAEAEDLAAELHALDAASKTIAKGDGIAALGQLDAYRRAFPSGSLSLEASVLRVEALERAGRHSEAVSAARAFVTRHARSPLAERMRQIAGS